MAKKKTGTKNPDTEEREYTIPLRRKCAKTPRYKKANKAIKSIKEFLVRHMKIRDRDLRKIKLDKYLNEQIWSRGIKKPPAKIKVRAIKDGKIVRVELAELPSKLKFKKAREEKRERKAAEAEKRKVKKSEEKPKEKTEEIKEEKKKEEKEKAKAVEESMKKLEKEAARKSKQMAKSKIKKSQQRRKALAK